MKQFFIFLSFVGGLLLNTGLAAAERIPSAPARYFNDYASVVSRATADRLNTRLEQFEHESSNQLLVVLYPKMESGSSVEDFTVRVAQAWGVGQKARNNGAVLFVFMQEHQLYLQVGYGLEARIPDAIAKRIIEHEIVPRFRAQDVDGGMTAAVDAMIAATKGEYRGTGRTQNENAVNNLRQKIEPKYIIILIVVIIIIVNASRRNHRPSIYMNPSRRSTTSWWDSGGGSSGGGGFSGGGGSFGGGGAGGKW